MEKTHPPQPLNCCPNFPPSHPHHSRPISMAPPLWTFCDSPTGHLRSLNSILPYLSLPFGPYHTLLCVNSYYFTLFQNLPTGLESRDGSIPAESPAVQTWPWVVSRFSLGALHYGRALPLAGCSPGSQHQVQARIHSGKCSKADDFLRKPKSHLMKLFNY